MVRSGTFALLAALAWASSAAAYVRQPAPGQKLLWPTLRTPFQAGNTNGVAFRTTCGLLTNARYDPSNTVTTPDQLSAHVHGAYGSPAFGPVVSHRNLTSQLGTTCNFPQARSVYWAPALYFRNPQTKLLELVGSYTFHYYMGGPGADDYLRAGHKEHAYPLNFRYVFGDASRRGGVIGQQASAKRGDPKWMCSTGEFDNPMDAKATFPGMFNKAGKLCQEWQGRQFYPECWDGRSLDSADHKSHMAYMVSGTCPITHPILLPTLLFQVHYKVGPVFQRYARYGLTAADFVMSTGDKTGVSLHSDFISGWDPAMLSNILRGCEKNGPNGQKVNEAFRCPANFIKFILPHPFLNKNVPLVGNLTMQGAVPNEKVTQVACLPGVGC